MIDNERSHKMRRYARWMKDIHADCVKLGAEREEFRAELMSFKGGI